MLDIPSAIQTSNGTTAHHLLVAATTTMIEIEKAHISPLACVGFAVLILATVVGNTLVLSALFLDKRLHLPSFFLIANMATADLLLGISVLPFSSILEILDHRWIFGQGFCSAWLALDVLCCTASIIALMAVSIDRYIGVTRPLNYGSIMTKRRTIYLIIIVWAVSILTSVVPLFGLTDRGQIVKGTAAAAELSQTCNINKNTFYTIFSSMVSFYIPVIILLILYSRVYQEAKKQGEKLENEKRRLYKIQYQIVSDSVREEQTHSNGHHSPGRMDSHQSDEHHNEECHSLANHADEESATNGTATVDDGQPSKKKHSDTKIKPEKEISRSVSSLVAHKKRAHRSVSQRLFTTVKRNSTFQNLHLSHSHPITPKDELMQIKRKLHNLKREKKAFRTLVLILGALLICWLPFFVTLPVMSILKLKGFITDENTENTWFMITFWLGYCNSALNPFVYAFSNRAIRRAFRQVICRRFCCLCRETWKERVARRHEAHSGSLTTETSQIAARRTSSLYGDHSRSKSKPDHELEVAGPAVFRGGSTGEPAVSFADFLADTEDDDNQTNQELLSVAAKQDLPPSSNA